MLRSLFLTATVLASGALVLGPSSGEACEAKAKADAQVKAKVSTEALAGKCSCKNAAECTCKKNQCECGKCGGDKRKMIEALKGSANPLKLPAEARYDATGGVFI